MKKNKLYDFDYYKELDNIESDLEQRGYSFQYYYVYKNESLPSGEYSCLLLRPSMLKHDGNMVLRAFPIRNVHLNGIGYLICHSRSEVKHFIDVRLEEYTKYIESEKSYLDKFSEKFVIWLESLFNSMGIR